MIATRAKPAELGGIIDRGITLYEEAVNLMWSVGAYGSLSASTSATIRPGRSSSPTCARGPRRSGR
jgi:hypothetical protein